MAKDKRYNTVKMLMEAGKISTIEELIEIVPKSIVAKDLNLHYYQFLAKMKKPALFSIEELVTLADKIEIDRMKIITPVVVGAKKKNDH
ncbi:hypothetical protein [Chitinophaga defluvii]|uniref:Uncharacterized protein n=1 Tax=Chitinophaga defluvii TaxID=3163343 RepID=A0ABV2T586_9BACT